MSEQVKKTETAAKTAEKKETEKKEGLWTRIKNGTKRIKNGIKRNKKAIIGVGIGFGAGVGGTIGVSEIGRRISEKNKRNNYSQEDYSPLDPNA